MPAAPGRNDPCHCGSGKKYKQCHLAEDEAKARAERAQGGETAAAETAEPERAAAVPRPKRHRTDQPWKRSAQNTRGFGQTQRAPRKVGGS
jgi:hypothetical protein